MLKFLLSRRFSYTDLAVINVVGFLVLTGQLNFFKAMAIYIVGILIIVLLERFIKTERRDLK